MRRRARRIVLATTALAALALVAACGPPAPSAPPAPSSPTAADVVTRTNYLRSLSGIPGLSVDGAMQANAQFHADRLAAGAASCGVALWHSPELSSWYPGLSAAENVACLPGCPTDGAGVIDLWWNSPPHRSNMMNGAYAVTGVATRCNGAVEIVVAQYRSG